MSCPLHNRYKVNHEPESDCDICWELWERKQKPVKVKTKRVKPEDDLLS